VRLLLCCLVLGPNIRSLFIFTASSSLALSIRIGVRSQSLPLLDLTSLSLVDLRSLFLQLSAKIILLLFRCS
jgi:hypothetical protein